VPSDISFVAPPRDATRADLCAPIMRQRFLMPPYGASYAAAPVRRKPRCHHRYDAHAAEDARGANAACAQGARAVLQPYAAMARQHKADRSAWQVRSAAAAKQRYGARCSHRARRSVFRLPRFPSTIHASARFEGEVRIRGAAQRRVCSARWIAAACRRKMRDSDIPLRH